MISFNSKAEPASAGHLRLVVNTAYPVGNRRARQLVQLRCVAGSDFTKATGLPRATDLTPAQEHFGTLGLIDRNSSAGVYPAFERY